MFKTIVLLIVVILSFSGFADCASKVKSRVHRTLAKSGQKISVSDIKVTHKEHLEIEQAAYIKEVDRFEVEVMGASLQKFSGLTTISGIGCKVENISEIKSLRI